MTAAHGLQKDRFDDELTKLKKNRIGVRLYPDRKASRTEVHSRFFRMILKSQFSCYKKHVFLLFFSFFLEYVLSALRRSKPYCATVHFRILVRVLMERTPRDRFKMPGCHQQKLSGDAGTYSSMDFLCVPTSRFSLAFIVTRI